MLYFFFLVVLREKEGVSRPTPSLLFMFWKYISLLKGQMIVGQYYKHTP